VFLTLLLSVVVSSGISLSINSDNFGEYFIRGTHIQGVSKRALQWYSQCCYVASVTKKFTPKRGQTIHPISKLKLLK
jgi:hypothetical protein